MKYFNKYQVIKVNALHSLSKQKALLKELKTIDDTNAITYSLKLKEKTTHFNDLEFKVDNFKEDTKIIQKRLHNLKDDIAIAHSKINDTCKRVSKTREENSFIKKEYLRTKIVLFKIYHNLKVDSIEEIIDTFNQIQFLFNDYSLQFQNLNKTITELNSDYHQHQKKLNMLNQRLMSKKDIEDNNEIIKLNTMLLEQTQYNKILADKAEIKENMLYSILKYMQYYDHKLSKLMHKLKHKSIIKIIGASNILNMIGNLDEFRNIVWSIPEGKVY
jgi:hypothetical protein